MFDQPERRIPLPEKCSGCPLAEPIATKKVLSEEERVEAITGVRVYGVTTYTNERVSEFDDGFGTEIDPAAARRAAYDYDHDVRELNRELASLTKSCPGIEASKQCGRLALADESVQVTE